MSAALGLRFNLSPSNRVPHQHQEGLPTGQAVGQLCSLVESVPGRREGEPPFLGPAPGGRWPPHRPGGA